MHFSIVENNWIQSEYFLDKPIQPKYYLDSPMVHKMNVNFNRPKDKSTQYKSKEHL